MPSLDEGINPYNVTWTSASNGSAGSMPLGNGEIGINAWAQEPGDLMFYIGRTDSWDENNRLLKIGLVRLRLSPGPFPPDASFEQELRLQGGELAIRVRLAGNEIAIHLWVDANHPVIQVVVESSTPIRVTASFQPWRTERVELPSIEGSDVQADADIPNRMHGPTIVEPDTVLRDLEDSIGWYHRNESSAAIEQMMRHQDLLESPWKDHVLHRTFGALIRSPDAQRIDDFTLENPQSTRHRFSVYVLTEHPVTSEQWTSSIQSLAHRIESLDFDERRSAHRRWWAEFWDRSHIRIRDRSGDSAGEDVCRGYNLQRYINACGGRGSYPIKYNGSIFTTPFPGAPGDADYRRWGPGYWWQNTRLPYESMCASGDFDEMTSLFEMYGGEVLEVCKYRTRRYFGIDGAFYPECIYPWGAVFPEAYGWGSTAAERTDKLQEMAYHKWEWVAGLELVHLMQDYFDHTEDEVFLKTSLLPTAEAVLRFFDNFYQTGEDGKLWMHPSQACETWWDCVAPMPEVAGLHAVTERLLALPEGSLTLPMREFVSALVKKLPELPVHRQNGFEMLAPAAKFANKRNVENPELYAVFPFRLVSFEKPNRALGIQALHHRDDRGPFGWRQEDIVMAILGLADEAREYVVERARNKDPDQRFPAFWGPNYDWTPDQCHGGVLMKALQAMLMQTEGGRIFLFPAWPSSWDVDFKLNVPSRTTVQGSVRDGKLVSLAVTPESRRKDVVVLLSSL
jgi:alpha-L-fucosidase 2